MKLRLAPTRMSGRYVVKPDDGAAPHLHRGPSKDASPMRADAAGVTAKQEPIKHTKELSTIASVDLGGMEALYALEATLHYVVSEDRRRLTMTQYAGKAVPLDELNGAALDYESPEEWTATIHADRTFEIGGALRWMRSGASVGSVVAVVRGTLLESGAIAYVFTATARPVHGTVTSGGTVAMQVPALW